MLQELYEQYKHSFSKSDHKIMEYLLRNRELLPYMTVEDLTESLHISPSTISRFWYKIDVKNMKELKQRYREQEHATPTSRLTSALSHWEVQGFDQEDYLKQYETNLRRTFHNLQPETILKAASFLKQADRIYILAPDASIGLAHIFQYRVRRLNIEMVFIKSGSEIYEYMMNMTSRDAVLLFSFSRLLSEVRVLLRHCRSIRCPSILFTDLFTFPGPDTADLVLYSYRGEPNEYHSMAAPMALLDILILNLMHQQTGSIDASRYLENLRARYAAFIKR